MKLFVDYTNWNGRWAWREIEPEHPDRGGARIMNEKLFVSAEEGREWGRDTPATSSMYWPSDKEQVVAIERFKRLCKKDVVFSGWPRLQYDFQGGGTMEHCAYVLMTDEELVRIFEKWEEPANG